MQAIASVTSDVNVEVATILFVYAEQVFRGGVSNAPEMRAVGHYYPCARRPAVMSKARKMALLYFLPQQAHARPYPGAIFKYI